MKTAREELQHPAARTNVICEMDWYEPNSAFLTALRTAPI